MGTNNINKFKVISQTNTKPSTHSNNNAVKEQTSSVRSDVKAHEEEKLALI